MWNISGKPGSGDIFELKKDAKYKYKLAIRYVARQFEGRFNDELPSSYLNKEFHQFLQSWRNKTCTKSINIHQVDGLGDNISIANKFAEHFSAVFVKNTPNESVPVIACS